jgi:hypothetical protein
MPFTARIERPQFHRARSATKKDGLATPRSQAETDESPAATASTKAARS